MFNHGVRRRSMRIITLSEIPVLFLRLEWVKAKPWLLPVEYIGRVWSVSNDSTVALNFNAMPAFVTALWTSLFLGSALMQWTQSAPLKIADRCPGYTASNVQKTTGGVTVDLTLAGAECNVYGKDLHDLKFEASYQTGKLQHYMCVGSHLRGSA